MLAVGSFEMLALSHDLRWKAGSGVNVTDAGLRLQAGGWCQRGERCLFKWTDAEHKSKLIIESSSALLSGCQYQKETACLEKGRQALDGVLVYNVQHLAEVNGERQRGGPSVWISKMN